MGYWHKHQRKDLEQVLRWFDSAGWRIESKAGYYRLYCPCGAHQRSFHLTPSNPNYGKQAIQWAKRTCSGAEGEGQ